MSTILVGLMIATASTPTGAAEQRAGVVAVATARATIVSGARTDTITAHEKRPDAAAIKPRERPCPEASPQTPCRLIVIDLQ